MSNEEIYNSNSNPSSTEDIIELGAYLLAGLFAGKHLQNKIVDHNRREFLDKLPMQNLGRWAEQDLRGFYRNKKFYVTQFPDTHPKVFPHAAKLLYALIKFHGNRRESVMGRLQLQSQVNNFIQNQSRVLGAEGPQWRDGNILKITQHNPNWNLAKFLNSTEIRDLIFAVKKDKRIDVAIYQSKMFGKIEINEELKEENWALWNLSQYITNNSFLLHIYDAGTGYDIHEKGSLIEYIRNQNEDSDLGKKIPGLNIENEAEWFLENGNENNFCDEIIEYIKNLKKISEQLSIKNSQGRSGNCAFCVYKIDGRAGFLISLSGSDSRQFINIIETPRKGS
jgi:hypothetical protein